MENNRDVHDWGCYPCFTGNGHVRADGYSRAPGVSGQFFHRLQQLDGAQMAGGAGRRAARWRSGTRIESFIGRASKMISWISGTLHKYDVALAGVVFLVALPAAWFLKEIGALDWMI
jgi:hypothetical protein